MVVSLAQLHKSLLAEWSKDHRNTNAVEQTLKQIGEALLDQTATASLDEKALTTIYKDYYEISALVAVLRNDMSAFDDAIPRVLSFYNQCPSAAENKFLMVGLNLMFLLASNRLSDFHMLLESIPQNIQSTNPYISTPVRLEQSLMEGAYNKVVLTEKTIPSQFYSVFIRIMMDAVRSDIALSIEKSFKLLGARDAAQMLLFSSDAERKWKNENGCFVFEAETGHVDKPTLDTARIAKQTIFYAKQLEMIV
ncbi:unnamed protein product [Nippostrongylus brasiliensis]|uniref:26S proteasome non-ATPase regulatory subunit 8 n=1 Tax=Nippostrongylus brasiliensis TaxID=27835 RepID=A0A158QZX1_NIPBR|nr:unnamed protein product [Nippostrongylus brasiliensis]